MVKSIKCSRCPPISVSCMRDTDEASGMSSELDVAMPGMQGPIEPLTGTTIFRNERGTVSERLFINCLKNVLG